MANLRLKGIDLENDTHIETEWDRWDALMQKGYDCFGSTKETEGLQVWQEAWTVFCSIIEQKPEKTAVLDLMEEQDYIYPIDGWLQDYEMELGNAGKNEERLAFCQKILDIFDWQRDDDSCFRCGIAESLFSLGKVQESFDYYEQWISEEPNAFNGINSYSLMLREHGDVEKAYEVLRMKTWGVSCDIENSFLFIHARELADYIGKKEESQWYQQQLDKFEASLSNWESEQDTVFDEFTAPSRIPVVKPQKIYPNDPCPCGSGKKYKKCCGRR